jgi:hypothetical protein
MANNRPDHENPSPHDPSASSPPLVTVSPASAPQAAAPAQTAAASGQASDDLPPLRLKLDSGPWPLQGGGVSGAVAPITPGAPPDAVPDAQPSTPASLHKPLPGLAPLPDLSTAPPSQSAGNPAPTSGPASRSLLNVPLTATGGQEPRPMVSIEDSTWVGRAHNPLLTSRQDEERAYKALPWYYRSLWLPIGFLTVMLIWMLSRAFPLRFSHDWTIETDPVQTDVSALREPEWLLGEARLQPVAEFDIDALVLHRKRYTFDYMSHLSPVDLALGWGIMSNVAILQHLSIWQRNRFYYFRVPADYPMSVQDIGRHSTNLHPVPASDAIRRQLLAIEPGDRVRLRGALVDIHLPDGGFIRSSRTRTDSGAGACEVMWVESVEVLYED